MVGIDITASLIGTGSSVAQCLNVISPDTFAIISGMGNISVVKFEKGAINLSIINDHLFESPCKKYFSLPDDKYLWGFGIRDFQILDLSSGIQQTHLLSHNGNDMIYSTTVVDTTDLKIWIDIVHHSFKKTDSNDISIIFDVIQNKVIDTIYGYGGFIFLLHDNMTLCELFDAPKPTTWKISSELIYDQKDNELTKKLSDLGISAYPESYSKKNMLMIGNYNTEDGTNNFASVKWDPSYEDISIQPFTYQQEKDIVLWEQFEISPDGKWAKTVARDYSTEKRTDDITFYAVNDSFPQSLSPPVYGGRSTRDGGGCFVETDDWGTVYVDISPEAPGYLVVYKMSDVMNKVVEKMRNLGK